MAKKTGNDVLGDPGHRVRKRAASSRPAFRYKQPRRRKLEPTEQTFGILRALASRALSHKHGSVAEDLRLPNFKPPLSPLAISPSPQHETVEVFDVI